MKLLLTSVFAFIVLSNSYYSDNAFDTENTVSAKNRQVKNVCLSKPNTTSNGTVKKVYAHKGSTGKSGIKKKVCSTKGGTSSGGKCGNA
ncbi:hypothetical protein [Emticicia agri]|uniref:Uncharacterized protein n=1 Tax=Emticicia agri TaxID=2492393 RepID=A0A4Q5LVH8_9BACT|nr:hypothetical protein [Emticicia agri]RYU93654.1 hypothetical protein EWM59_21215 [Emticicia agri]